MQRPSRGPLRLIVVIAGLIVATVLWLAVQMVVGYVAEDVLHSQLLYFALSFLTLLVGLILFVRLLHAATGWVAGHGIGEGYKVWFQAAWRYFRY